MVPREKVKYDNATCLYVGNLSPTTFDNDLFKHFAAKGYRLKNAKVMLDQTTRKSRCFGYLNFFTQEEAIRCFNEQNNTLVDGKQLVLNKKKDSEFDADANIVVTNLPQEMTQGQVYELFKQFGPIISCKLEINSDGKSRGYAFVQYEHVEAAQSAIAKLHNSLQMG